MSILFPPRSGMNRFICYIMYIIYRIYYTAVAIFSYETTFKKKYINRFNDVVDKAKVSLANESHSDNEIEFLNNLIDDFSQKRIELDSLDKKYAELHLHQTTTKIINGLTKRHTRKYTFHTFRILESNFHIRYILL